MPFAALPAPPPALIGRPAPRAQVAAVKLPAASRWALPPVIRVRSGNPGSAAAARQALANPALAIAPGVRRALERGEGRAAIASL
ncbi:MAG: hypothetical protein QOE98_637, partial [Gaiellaceae bacterium]|nr:hypothetical protein [Gaiellaceae bacterium]